MYTYLPFPGGRNAASVFCHLYVFYKYFYYNIFINVYMVLFLFNNAIFVFLLYDCMFMYDYPD
jgi:hypothetical protein